ncbi:MAG: hypothetical protein RL538_512 [Candidatus Parcubacteria bacterium]
MRVSRGESEMNSFCGGAIGGSFVAVWVRTGRVLMFFPDKEPRRLALSANFDGDVVEVVRKDEVVAIVAVVLNARAVSAVAQQATDEPHEPMSIMTRLGPSRNQVWLRRFAERTASSSACAIHASQSPSQSMMGQSPRCLTSLTNRSQVLSLY